MGRAFLAALVGIVFACAWVSLAATYISYFSGCGRYCGESWAFLLAFGGGGIAFLAGSVWAWKRQ